MTKKSMSQNNNNLSNVMKRRLFVGSMTTGLVFGSSIAAFANELFPTPKVSEGPFYPDKLPLDQDNDLLIIKDSGTTAKGTVANITGRILGPDGKPIVGAIVEIWQCDANGVYLHSKGGDRVKMDAGFQGYGRFKVGDDGAYRFRTIRPVPYPGRTPHIHYKIKLGEKYLLTTQLFVKDDPNNEKDGLFNRLKSDEEKNAACAEFKAKEDSEELDAAWDIVLGKTPEAE